MENQLKATDFLEEYEITQNGQVISNKTKKQLKPDHSTAYFRVILSKNGVKKRFSVHRLVAIVYIPNPDMKPCVNHINGIKTDNRVENLEWCTFSENELHSRMFLGKKTIHSEETKSRISAANTGNVFSQEIRDKFSRIHKGRPAHNKRKVILNNESVYESITVAAAENNISCAAIVSNIKGRSIKTKVGVWKYF